MFERFSERALGVIVAARWSAERRGGWYIEPEDLLHALIREDRGEFAAISREMFPGSPAPTEGSAGSPPPFFSSSVAADLLQELHETPDFLSAETGGAQREPAPRRDMPVSQSLKSILALVAKAHRHDTKTIEPLDLLAGILENRDSSLAQLLQHHGITRQKVAGALDSGS